MAGRVFVFGSINTDLVVYVTRLPQPGETVSGGTFASFPGGKGANQAVAAARAGAAVEMYGCLGDDAFGRERRASLEAAGVSTGRVRLIAGAASGIAQITVDAEGENTIAVAPGANALFDGEGILLDRPPRGRPGDGTSANAAPPRGRPGDGTSVDAAPPRGETWVSLFQNEVPQDATERLISQARAAGHTVFWNLAPTLSRRPSEAALAATDLLICNRNELDALTGGGAARNADTDGVAALERQARVPLEWGVRSLVVTLGREGSLWVTPTGALRVGAFPVEAVDTVGAGDCFCGVLAAAAADGMDMPRALRRASAAAAISATRRGAQTSMPLRAEVDAFLTERGG